MRAASLIIAAAMALSAPALAEPRAARPGAVTVSNAEVRATLGGSANSAAYMVVANHGAGPDRLLSVSCACASQAEVHVSRMRGGMMSMAPAGPVTIPAHGRLVFAPGGLHIMLTGVKGRLVDGRRQTMTLRFERAGQVTAVFSVRDRIGGGHMDPMPGMHH